MLIMSRASSGSASERGKGPWPEVYRACFRELIREAQFSGIERRYFQSLAPGSVSLFPAIGQPGVDVVCRYLNEICQSRFYLLVKQPVWVRALESSNVIPTA